MKQLLCILALLFSASAFAQAATPCDSVTGSGLCLSWQPPPAVPGVTVTSYNVYQVPLVSGACAAFTPSATNRLAAGVTTLFWLQTSYANTAVCNEVTAVSAAGVEGPPSAVNTFPLPTPGAPQGLQAIKK
jgi:hypothetical protein